MGWEKGPSLAQRLKRPANSVRRGSRWRFPAIESVSIPIPDRPSLAIPRRGHRKDGHSRFGDRVHHAPFRIIGTANQIHKNRIPFALSDGIGCSEFRHGGHRIGDGLLLGGVPHLRQNPVKQSAAAPRREWNRGFSGQGRGRRLSGFRRCRRNNPRRFQSGVRRDCAASGRPRRFARK